MCIATNNTSTPAHGLQVSLVDGSTVCWLNTNYTVTTTRGTEWLEEQELGGELPGVPGEVVDIGEGREALPGDAGLGRVVGYFGMMQDGSGRRCPRCVQPLLPKQEPSSACARH